MTSMAVSELRRLRALRTLDLIRASEIVDWAAEHLVFNQGLLGLAALSSDASSADVDREADLVLVGAGERALSITGAARLLALEAVVEIAEGLVEPVVGARRLWALARRAPGIEPDLRPFIGLASEWEDAPEFRFDYEADIVAEATKFLAGSEASGQ